MQITGVRKAAVEANYETGPEGMLRFREHPKE
jgi:hypothetical protein